MFPIMYDIQSWFHIEYITLCVQSINFGHSDYEPMKETDKQDSVHTPLNVSSCYIHFLFSPQHNTDISVAPQTCNPKEQSGALKLNINLVITVHKTSQCKHVYCCHLLVGP